MNNIVTITDFKGKYAISVSEYALDTFNDFIAEEQYDLLIDMLGADLYNDFNTNPTNARWQNLLNGVTYTDYNGYTQNWRGLKTLLVPYIYSKFTLENYKKQVQSGVVKPKFENSEPLNERERKEVAYEAWNNFTKIWYECYNFLYTNSSTYTDFECFFKQKYQKSLVILTGIK